VTSQPGNIVVTSTTASASVPGLDYGVAYTFTVVVTNSYGNAESSAPSAPVTPARAPDPVINLHATAGDGDATVTWDAPAFDGGSPITSYTIDAWSDGITMTVPGDARSATLTGLTDGVTYEFLVIPSNARGATLSAYSNPVVPVGPPAVVAGLVVTVVGDEMVRLEWDGATTDAPATSYTVTSLPDGRTFTTTDAFLDVYGLTDGVQYTFTVVANSPLGNAAPSAPVVATPARAPDAVSGVIATAGNGGQVTLTWSAPFDGGSPIEEYTVYGSNGAGGFNVPAGSSSAVFLSLAIGTSYTFDVVASNSFGSSAAVTSNTVTAAP
jgi:hypothetical protein